MERPLASGWSCAVCGANVDIAEPLRWRCPNATDADRHHALELVQGIAPLRGTDDPNPFIAFRPFLAWDSFAAANGMTEDARAALVRQVDAAAASVAGVGFHATPFGRADSLSDALGFGVDGGVWVKDETGQVAGSHKPRHLMTILLHLLTTETLGLAPWTTEAGRPPLAIASCGNAAFAAATLAAGAAWPIRVFVPPSADPAVLAHLAELGADIVECPRRPDDPAGDPCIHRFREAVAGGAIPFTVQGTENVWCLDGGRTIGWEMARHLEENEAGPSLDRIFVQVGAGTFAASTIAGFKMSGVTPRLHAVQTDSCAPLNRAYEHALQLGGPRAAATRWSECMWPWEHVGSSAADGILDDETYDWIPVVRAIAEGRGAPIVVTEARIMEANELARSTTAINASHTGTAGLAGLLAVRANIESNERVAVIFSGIARSDVTSDRAAGTGDARRKPKGATWESWVDRQIRDGIERGEFENLPGKGKPLDGIGADGVDSHRDEDWWLKAKLRRERLSYLPTTLAVRKEVEEAIEAIGRATNEHVVRRIVADINERIRDVNRRGADGPPSTVMPLDEDATVDRWRTQRNARGA